MKEIINGIHTIISNKTPSINNKRLEISKPNPAFNTIFPNKIKIGNKSGIVINAPKTDPLFKLKELPNEKRLIKIYVEISIEGRAIFIDDICPAILIEKNVPSKDIGTPINNQYINIFMNTIENKESFAILKFSRVPSS